MSTECQGSASGSGQLYRGHFGSFYSRTAITFTVCSVNIYISGERVTDVHSTEGRESSSTTYPVLLLVAYAPSASLRCSAWSLLLLTCHGNLPLDALVGSSCRPGALLLRWAAGGLRPLFTLGDDEGQHLLKN